MNVCVCVWSYGWFFLTQIIIINAMVRKWWEMLLKWQNNKDVMIPSSRFFFPPLFKNKNWSWLMSIRPLSTRLPLTCGNLNKKTPKQTKIIKYFLNIIKRSVWLLLRLEVVSLSLNNNNYYFYHNKIPTSSATWFCF